MSNGYNVTVRIGWLGPILLIINFAIWLYGLVSIIKDFT